MVLTDEQTKEVKKQLLAQLDNVPAESRESVKKEIEEMSSEKVEEFLKKNKQLDIKEGEQCIFCGIVNGTSPAMKVDENEEAIAVLDINPISKGHTLIIPKDHNKEPTEKTQELAFKVGGRILKSLNPKDITTRGAKVMEHTILNVIPIYEDTDLEQRIRLQKEDFEEVNKKISVFKETQNPTIKETEVGEIEQPKTIPKEKPKAPICTFCGVAQKQTPSFIIDENKDNLAILEINPISNGHTLIIPKKHAEVTEIPANAFSLAKKIAKKIKTRLKPNDVKINPTSVNNHALIELIPIYDTTDLEKREKKSEEEFVTLKKLLEVKKKATSPKKTVKKEATKKEQKKKGSFILKKRPKYPDLPQFGSRIP